jgi:hypothetical protein
MKPFGTNDLSSYNFIINPIKMACFIGNLGGFTEMLHLMGIFLSLLRLSHQFLMFLHTLPPNITLQSVFSQFIGFKVLAVADPDLLTSPEYCNGKVRNQV